MADPSAETQQAKREWQDLFKVMKGNNLQPRLLYQARISFRFNGEFKTFTDKQKLSEFSTTKRGLQQMLRNTTNAKELLYTGNTREGKEPQKQTQNNLENGNRNIQIANYLKCKWIKCSNQKTQTG